MLPLLPPEDETDHVLGNAELLSDLFLGPFTYLIEIEDGGDVGFRELGRTVLAAVAWVVGGWAF